MRKNVSFLFVLPALAAYTVLKIYPMLTSLFYSLTNWDGLRSTYRFVGLGNFGRMFADPSFLNSLKVTFVYTVVVVAAVNILGVIFAVLLNKVGRLTNLYRSVFFMPVVISQVAVAYVWLSIYSYNGALNFLMDKMNLEALQLQWLASPRHALLSIAAVDIWRTLGFHMVIILAALQTIPYDMYESASIDGCSPWQKFRFVTLPLLMPGLSVSVIMGTLGAMKQYDLIKVMTDGGPLGSTETVAYNIVYQAFENNMQGYACALALFLFVLIAGLTVIQNAWFGKREVEY